MKAHAPTSLAALDRARDLSNATRAMRRVAGLAWARAWRARMRPVFDRMEADGCFMAGELAR